MAEQTPGIGDAIGSNYRINFDLATPVVQGIQLADSREQRRLAQEQRRREQEDKVASELFSLTPDVHPTLAPKARETINRAISIGINPKASNYEKRLAKQQAIIELQEYNNLSTYRKEYDKIKTIVKNPGVAAAFANGRNEEAEAILFNLEKEGLGTRSQNPYDNPNAAAPVLDFRKDFTEKFKYDSGANSSLYTIQRVEAIPGGNGQKILIREMSPQTRLRVAAENYNRERDLPNLMYGDLQGAFFKNLQIERMAAKGTGLPPDEVANLAAVKTMASVLPSDTQMLSPGQSVSVSVGGETPAKDRDLFTDQFINVASYNKSQKPATYDEYINGLNNITGGRIMVSKSGAKGVELPIPSNEIETPVKLSPSTDRLTFGPNGTPVKFDENIIAKTQRIIVGSAFRDANGNLTWIDKDNFDKYKDQLGSDAIIPTFMIEYVAAPKNGTASGISETDYAKLQKSGESAIKFQAYQLIAADELGGSAMGNRYPSLSKSYNKVIKASFTKSGERVSGIETNTQPKKVTKVSSGQTGAATSTGTVKKQKGTPSFTEWQKTNKGGTFIQYKKAIGQ